MTLLPSKLVHEFDAADATDTVTKALEGMKQRAASLVPKPVYQPRQEEIPEATSASAPVMRGPAVEEPAPVPQITLPSVQEIISGGTEEAGTPDVGNAPGSVGGRGLELDSYSPGNVSSATTDLAASPLSPITLPSVEEITGIRRQPERPSALTTLGGTPEAEALTQPGGTAYTAPQTPTAAPQAASDAPQDIEGYIRYAAQKRGIDPDVAVKAANTEGGTSEPAKRGTFATGSSWWPFQLHYGGKGYESLGTTAGMGNDFTAQTGIQPGDPNGWKQSVDYALDAVAKNGWGAWYGPKTVGITGRVGVSPNARPVGIEASAETAMPPAGQSTSAQFSELTPNQFTAGATLSSADAAAACGPAAAVAFARRNNRNPTLDESVALAREVGWSPSQGMAGPASEVSLLKKMGVAASLATPNEQRIAEDVQRGNPVILDTPGHYFVAERYDPNSGKFDFGNSAKILKAAGGNAWYSLGEIAKLGMGSVRTAIHMDSPESPSPSVVAGSTGQTPEPQRAPALVQAVDSATDAPPPSPRDALTDQWSQMATSMGQAADRIKGVPVAQAMQSGNVMALEDLSSDGRPAGRDIGSDYGPAGTSSVESVGQAEASGGQGVRGVSAAPPPRDIRGDYGPRATEPGDFEINAAPRSVNDRGGVGTVLPRQGEEVFGNRMVESTPSAAITPSIQGASNATVPQRSYPPLETAPAPVQPSGAVEPAPPPVAPAPTGESSDPWSRVTSALKDAVTSVFGGANKAATGALNQAGQPLNEPLAAVNRTAVNALNTAGEPLNEPVDQFRRDLGRRLETPSPTMRAGQAVSSGLTGLAESSQQDMETFRVLNGRQLQGERLTPEEEQQMAESAVRIVGNVDGLQSVGDTVPGVIGAARRIAGEAAPSAGIVSRAQADEAAQAVDTFVPSSQRNIGQGIARGAVQGGISGGQAASEQEGATPLDVARGAALGAVTRGISSGVGAAAGPRGAGMVARAVRATDEMRQSGDPALGKLANMMDEPPPVAPTGRQADNLIERARQAVVRQVLNRGVTMDKIQEDIVKATGGKLPMEDRITALQRLNPSSTVDMQIQDEILQPLRQLGSERPHVSAIMTLKQNIDQAAEKGAGRAFSGGLNAQESQQALDALRKHLGDERFAKYEQDADTFIDFNRRTLDLGVQGHLVPPDLAQHLNDTYPNYSPTNITKYATIDGPGGVPVGKQIGLNDNGLMKLSEEGTTAAKQDPIEASVAARYDMMRRVHRNQVTEKFIDVAKQDPELSQHVREIISKDQWEQQGRTLQPGQTLDVDRLTPDQTRIGWFDQNAVKHEYLVDDWAKPLIEGSSVPEMNAYQKFLQEWRSAVTDRSLSFTVRNVPRDAWQTFNTMLVREGGPSISNVNKVVGMMAESYRDAFKGVRDGTFHGNVKDYLEGGGGYARASGRGLEEQAQVVDDIARTGGVQIKNPMDLYKLATDPLSELNKRFELAPRGAVFGQAKTAGASDTAAVIAARDLMPYEVSGEFTKALNSYVPFLTARIAGAASQTRLALQHPTTYLPTVLAATTGPAIAIEMYNRMDEDRSKAYDDVPNYLKFMGNVVMLPWAGKDTYGMPLPNYLFLPTGPVSPFSILGHAVGGAIMGKGAKPNDYAEMFNAITESLSPVDTSAGGALSSILGPVGSTAVGLATGKDLFRGSEVATSMGDLEASRLSQGIARGANAALSKVPAVGPALANVRPSQVEFAARGLTGGPGAQVLAASNIGRKMAGEAENIQDMPGVGGLVSPLVGNRTGGVMSREADRIMAGSAGQAILDAGVRWRPEPVDDHVGKVGLTRAERGEVQQETNTIFNQNVANVREWVPDWDTYDTAGKEQVFKNLYANARKTAEGNLLARYPERFAVPEQFRRVGIEQERKAG